MDCSQGHSVVACALRSQLGPLGQNEFVCDSGLRTLDLRAPSRAGANLHFAPGAARLAWHPAEHSSVIVASPGGALQQLDARGHFTAPEQLLIEPLALCCGLLVTIVRPGIASIALLDGLRKVAGR